MRIPRTVRAAAVATLIATIAAACSTNGNKTNPPPSIPAPTSTQSVVADYPTFLDKDGVGRSQDIGTLGVGETGFVVTGLQSFPYLKHLPKGGYCLVEGTPWWPETGRKVGDVVSPNIAIKRTALGSYTMITRPGFEPAEESEPLYGGTCAAKISKFDSSPEARAVLGLPQDFAVGQIRYVPAENIWVAEPTSTSGILVTSSTDAQPFPGGLAIMKGRDGFVLLKDPADWTGLRYVGSKQIEEMKGYPLISLS